MDTSTPQLVKLDKVGRPIRYGEDSSHWKGGPINKDCLVCGESFSFGRTREQTAKFCSFSCHNIFKFTGSKHKDWKGGISIGGNRLPNRAFHQRQRKHKLRGAEGKHTSQEWTELKIAYDFTCPCCQRKEPEIKLTEDHIKPVSKGGDNSIDNIQPLCVSCNSFKNTKEIKYDKPKTK